VQVLTAQKGDDAQRAFTLIADVAFVDRNTAEFGCAELAGVLGRQPALRHVHAVLFGRRRVQLCFTMDAVSQAAAAGEGLHLLDAIVGGLCQPALWDLGSLRTRAADPG